MHIQNVVAKPELEEMDWVLLDVYLKITNAMVVILIAILFINTKNILFML